MSYVVDRWNEGEVHIEGNAVGWKMRDGEFRPLMSDALEQLFDEALIDETIIEATNAAREIYNRRAIGEYKEAQKNRSAEAIAEERAEALAAFGPSEEIVNIFTGESFVTGDDEMAQIGEEIVKQAREKVIKPARKGSKKEVVAKIIEEIGLTNRQLLIERIMTALSVTKANAGVYVYNYKKARGL